MAKRKVTAERDKALLRAIIPLPDYMKALFQFPKIYRSFTELPRARKFFYTKVFIVSFISGFLVMASFLKGVELVQSFQAVRVLDSKRSELLSQKNYWEEVVAKHSDYRDAYFKLAVLSYQLGDRKSMNEYIAKTLEIDPNFKDVRVFAQYEGE